MSSYMRLPSRGGDFRRGGGGGRRNWGRQGRGRGGRGRGSRGRGGRGHQRWQPRNDNSDGDFTGEIEELGTRSADSLCVAIQGCCHGELDAIYNRLEEFEETTEQKVDVLLCCGDFQSLRNEADYHSLAVPPKYRSLGSFHRYYSGEKVAPFLTIFVGGNHEASQPLQELYYGGWVAPNIYYLGAAGVVNVAGVRIGGISGIYKSHDYTQGRFERPPYDRSSLRSVYHVRNTDVYRLKCLDPENRIDIMLSHDWPQGIEQHGDTNKLLRQKPFFRDEVQRNDLGSPPNRELLDILKPKWWFSAHLHVKFKARVNHVPSGGEERSMQANSNLVTGLVPSQVSRATKIDQETKQAGSIVDGDELGIEISEEVTTTTHFQSLRSSKACNEPDLTDLMTQFLALDKCLPRRNHLSILHIPCKGRKDVIEYDPEWLVVLQKTHHLSSTDKRRVHCPRKPIHVTNEDVDAVQAKLAERDKDNETPLAIPLNFSQTVPPQTSPGNNTAPGRFMGSQTSLGSNTAPFPFMGNPQTDEFLNMLGLNHIITLPYTNQLSTPAAVQDEIEIDLDVEEAKEGDIFLDHGNGAVAVSSRPVAPDANEIDLDDDEDGDVRSATESDNGTGSARGDPEDNNEIILDEDEDEDAAAGDTNSDDITPVSKKARANS